MNIVHENVRLGDSILADSHNFRMRALHANALIAILAKDHWLAMFEVEYAIRPHASLCKLVEGVIVKDVAVLVDLNKRHAFVFGRRLDHSTKMLDVNIDSPRNKR